MKFLATVFSAIAAVTFSSLAAAQSTGTTMDKDRAGVNASTTPTTKADTNDAAVTTDKRAGAGATDDMDKDKHKKKSAKKSSKKSKAKDKDKQSKAAGGASAGSTREPSTNSSPSKATGEPGSANQGSVHNDETKK
jgi:hypothetical protein